MADGPFLLSRLRFAVARRPHNQGDARIQHRAELTFWREAVDLGLQTRRAVPRIRQQQQPAYGIRQRQRLVCRLGDRDAAERFPHDLSQALAVEPDANSSER